jgi:hypothetical protein
LTRRACGCEIFALDGGSLVGGATANNLKNYCQELQPSSL